jgi:hypothetical protein
MKKFSRKSAVIITNVKIHMGLSESRQCAAITEATEVILYGRQLVKSPLNVLDFYPFAKSL